MSQRPERLSIMKNLNDSTFIHLFKEVSQKCFGRPLTEPLSETDSKLLANTIFEETGLVIGVKSIKNYSHYIFNSGEGKKQNPSTATLDTLARYLLNAPATDEIRRKKQESHHPYWFQYRSGFINSVPGRRKPATTRLLILAATLVLVTTIVLLLVRYSQTNGKAAYFRDDFNAVGADSLRTRGWLLKNEDISYWNKRNTTAGHLSLYTLIGDNWPDAEKSRSPRIKNLLVREIGQDCFAAEIHLTDFLPNRSWQQAGIVLSEDSTFTGKVLRLSIGYNDFFGGYKKQPEIIIQAVGSSVDGNLSRPEEIAHVTLFSGEPETDSLIKNNLSRVGLKIEKKENHYRFLYTNGRMESFAFKEATRGDFAIQPKYIGIFAMQGLAETENPTSAHFDSFSLIGIDCKK